MECQFSFEDDIEKIERKRESLKKYRSRMKTRFKQLIRRYKKCGLDAGYFIRIVEDIDDLFCSLEHNIKESIAYIKEDIEKHGRYYEYIKDELIKKGVYPNIWLFHGGLMGGRGVIIQPNRHSEKIYPILLEDFKKLKEIQNERKLNRGDIETLIEKFNSLNFNQKQENYVNCYNEHLKIDTERRVKCFEERIAHTEKELTLIDRDPSRERHLKEYLENAKINKKKCIETLEKLKSVV